MNELERLEKCPLCGRPMLEDESVNEHHPVPKSRGGKLKFRIHVVCHSKIHSLFTEKELEREYGSFEALRAHPDIQKFVKWVRRKAPGFRTRNKKARRKRRR